MTKDRQQLKVSVTYNAVADYPSRLRRIVELLLLRIDNKSIRGASRALNDLNGHSIDSEQSEGDIHD